MAVCLPPCVEGSPRRYFSAESSETCCFIFIIFIIFIAWLSQGLNSYFGVSVGTPGSMFRQ